MVTSYHSAREKFLCKREKAGDAGFLSDYSRRECKGMLKTGASFTVISRGPLRLFIWFFYH